jgi:hypothetical protein
MYAARMPRTPGRHWFLAGTIILLLFGAVHSLAVLDSFFGTPDPRLAEADAALRRAVVPVGPLRPTAWGAVQILNVSYALFLLTLGVMNLLTLGPLIHSKRLRPVAALNAALALALLAVALAFQFPPPAVFALGAFLCFGVAAFRAPGRAAPHV